MKIKKIKKSKMVSVLLCLGIQGTRKIAASLVLGGFSWVLGPPKGYHEKKYKMGRGY